MRPAGPVSVTRLSLGKADGLGYLQRPFSRTYRCDLFVAVEDDDAVGRPTHVEGPGDRDRPVEPHFSVSLHEPGEQARGTSTVGETRWRAKRRVSLVDEHGLRHLFKYAPGPAKPLPAKAPWQSYPLALDM